MWERADGRPVNSRCGGCEHPHRTSRIAHLTSRHVFFDAFGTLVTLDRPFERLQANLESLGHAVPPADVEAAMRREFAYYVAHSVRGRADDSLGRLRLDCAGVLLEGLRERGCPLPLRPEETVDVLMGAIRFELLPDALPALEALEDAGVRMGLISNWDCSLRQVVHDLGLDAYLECVVVSALCGCEKPDPAIFREALRLTGAAAERSLHVGDSYENDVLGARAAGMTPILLDRRGEYSITDVPIARDLPQALELLRG